MANRTYLPSSHRLLPGYTPSHPLAPRNSAGASPPSPEFSYDVYPREATRAGGGGGRELSSAAYSRTPSSPGSSALNMAYSGVQDFPYGLSGVQMPTYNFGSELYNYVSNGFPRKSRMCTFCNKVFTRSTTRRYHERRCPLLRASNSLAKNEENNAGSGSSSFNALKEQQAQQRQKESSGGGRGGGHHGSSLSNASSLPRILSSSITNTTTAQSIAMSQASPPLPSLHPAYPTSFPKSSLAAPNSPRSSAYAYPHPYSPHFYNSISAAALASLDQNSKKQQQQQQEADALSWASSSPPSSAKLQDQINSFGAKLKSSSLTGHLSLSKTLTPETVVDLTARYCADFTARTQPPVFPAPSFRAPPHSPPSPEPGETKMNNTHHDDKTDIHGRESPMEAMNAVQPRLSGKDWKSSHQEANIPTYNAVSSSSSFEVEGYRRQNSSPASETWPEKDAMAPTRPYMKVEPLDEEDEEDFEDEEDEEEVEEDEEQFKMEETEGSDVDVQSLNYKGLSFNPLICKFCNKDFPDSVTRKAHEELHVQKKLYACCLCTHSFHCAYSLRLHTLRRHKEGPYKCKYCSIDYGPASDLRTHLIKEHSLPKTEFQSLEYFCLVTNSSSPSPNPMLSNAVSEGEQDDVARDADGFKKHHRRSADHPSSQYDYSEETSKALLSPSGSNDVTSAVIGKNGIGEEQTELCKICNKSFTKSYIRLHERAHADQKPYECPICNKRFGYKNNMKSHMKLHQGLKPYQCQICGARFTRGSTLRRHGRRHNISHSAMLDYVLYDQHGGRTAAAAAAAAAAASLGQKLSMVPTSVPGAKGQYVLPGQNSVLPPPPQAPSACDVPVAISTQHSAYGAMPSLISAVAIDKERFNTNGIKQRSPPHRSPPHHPPVNSPRVTSSHFTSHNSITNPMVGGLAAVAAANLFAYPNAAAAAAAPHLYQFYASANPLMGYPHYPTNATTQSVQSDALNLCLNKRKSPESVESQIPTECKQPRMDATCNSASSDTSVKSPQEHGEDYTKKPDMKAMNGVKMELNSPTKEINVKEPYNATPSPANSPKIDRDHKSEAVDSNDVKVKANHHNDVEGYHHHHPSSHHPHAYQQQQQQDEHTHLPLKVSTEDFGTQVNICCPSPQVNSSTGSVHHSSSNNSPVGSSSGPDGHLHPRASPSGVSDSSSPVNSAPSPTTDGGHDLLLTLLSNGRLFCCSFCDIYFTEYAMFRLHQKYHQCDMARPFLCSVCGEDCKDKTYFTVHLSEHLGLGPKNGLP